MKTKPSDLYGDTWAKRMVFEVEERKQQTLAMIIDEIRKGKYGTKNRAELILKLEAML